MEFLPIVVRAEYRGEFKIFVAFNDGLASTIDFSKWLTGPVFESLRDSHYFQRFFIDGGTIAWPNGADIAPETLYERAESSGQLEELADKALADFKAGRTRQIGFDEL